MSLTEKIAEMRANGWQIYKPYFDKWTTNLTGEIDYAIGGLSFMGATQRKLRDRYGYEYTLYLALDESEKLIWSIEDRI